MSELINKGALVELLEEKMFNSEAMCPVIKITDVLEIVEELPTVTEADIRAKALKRVQTAFRNHYETMRANKIEDCVNWADWLDSMVAEQLKGE